MGVNGGETMKNDGERRQTEVNVDKPRRRTEVNRDTPNLLNGRERWKLNVGNRR